jgi:hypothetical protein
MVKVKLKFTCAKLSWSCKEGFEFFFREIVMMKGRDSGVDPGTRWCRVLEKEYKWAEIKVNIEPEEQHCPHPDWGNLNAGRSWEVVPRWDDSLLSLGAIPGKTICKDCLDSIRKVKKGLMNFYYRLDIGIGHIPVLYKLCYMCSITYRVPSNTL